MSVGIIKVLIRKEEEIVCSSELHVDDCLICLYFEIYLYVDYISYPREHEKVR